MIVKKRKRIASYEFRFMSDREKKRPLFKDCD